MVAKASGIDSVFVRVIPATRGSAPPLPSPTSRGDDPRRVTYAALVYTRLPVRVGEPVRVEGGAPSSVAGDPLAGVELFSVNWDRYAEIASAYFDGAKAGYLMRERLLEAVTPNLGAILTGELGATQPTRTWFHSEAPEINQLPWELLAYGTGPRLAGAGTFVRGVPPETATPLVPVVDRLRLGLVDPARRRPRLLEAALAGASAAVEVVELGGGPREALREAAGRGLELVHVVADAQVTVSYEGVLRFPGTDEPAISSGEAASLLRGSRVQVVGATPPEGEPSRSRGPQGGSSHGGFAYFATSPYPLPTFVVPVGPLDDAQGSEFWARFYRTLGDTFSAEEAMAEGQRAWVVPVGLFLRQLQPAAFKRVEATQQPTVEPTLAVTQLAGSQELLKQLELLNETLGVKSARIERLVKREQRRQAQLQEDVSPWIEGVHEE